MGQADTRRRSRCALLSVPVVNVALSVILLLTFQAASGQAIKNAAAKKKILVSGLDESSIAALQRSAPANVRILATSPDRIFAEIGDADALISPQLTGDQLRAARQLKWVQILNAGVEGTAPLLNGSAIILTNLKIVLGPEVADHAMALLLALTRCLYETIPAQAKRESPSGVGPLVELRGKTAVIVGLGGVGEEIAERAQAFGMKIIGVDPQAAPPPQIVKPDQIDRVLPLADVVFVSAPETAATRGMIGPAQFQEMKPGAYFIAVSRGALYSTDALVKALASKRLAGAGLDATNPQPLPSDSPLWQFKDVVITPHIAGSSDGALTRVLELLEANIRLFAAGQPLLNVVDKSRGY